MRITLFLVLLASYFLSISQHILSDAFSIPENSENGQEVGNLNVMVDLKARQVVSGSFYTMVIDQDSMLWAWGLNYAGQLGDGTNENRNYPVQIGQDKWLKVTTGNIGSYAFSLGIKKDSTLWVWGSNLYGVYGNGETGGGGNTPVQVGTRDDWTDVEAGDSHVVGVAAKALIAWGYNAHGKIGTLDNESTYVPRLINAMNVWEEVGVGEYFSVARKEDGTLWTWGRNEGGLGTGLGQMQLSMPTQIGTDTDWKTISVGKSHVLATKTGGGLYGWGENGNGQLGNNSTVDGHTPRLINSGSFWERIMAGENYSIAVLDDGALYAWGYNQNGVLGNGNEDGSVTVTPAIVAADGWLAVSSTRRKAVGVKSDSTVWTWGENKFGSSGNGYLFADGDKMLDPVQVRRFGALDDLQNETLDISGGDPAGVFEINSDGSIVIADATKLDADTQSNYLLKVKLKVGDVDTTSIARIRVTDVNDNAPRIVLDTIKFLETHASDIRNVEIDDTIAFIPYYDADLGISKVVNRKLVTKNGQVWTHMPIPGILNKHMSRYGKGIDFAFVDEGYAAIDHGGNWWNISTQSPTKIDSVHRFRAVTSGLGLTLDGRIYNTSGKLADERTDWANLYAHRGYAYSIKEGEIYAYETNNGMVKLALSPQTGWERFRQGDLFYNTGTSKFYALDVVDGKLSATELALDMSSFTHVSHTEQNSGDATFFGVKENGTLWAWGKNNNGQYFGTGYIDSTYTVEEPIQIGVDTVWKSVFPNSYPIAAIQEDGSLWTWGYYDKLHRFRYDFEEVRFELIGGTGQEHYDLGADGSIVAKDSASLDREQGSYYSLVFNVTDGVSTVKDSVIFELEDYNDNPAQIVVDTIWIEENLDSGTVITKVVVEDADEDPDYYYLNGGSATYFDIDSLSGQIRVVGTIDRESIGGSTSFQVNLMEGTLRFSGITTYSTSDQESIVLYIKDANDNIPVIRDFTNNTVTENTSNGYEFGSLVADDGDSSNVMQDWKIVSGNEAGVFGIVDSTGLLYIADSTNLDYEQYTSFILGITVSDGVNTSGIKEVIFYVNDDTNENNFAPSITNSNGSLYTSISEGVTGSGVLMTLTASDNDPIGNYSWVLISGNEDGRVQFSPNGQSADIRYDANNFPLDAEEQDQYVLKLLAYDGRHYSDTTDVTIDITNVYEASYIVQQQTLEIAEDADTESVLSVDYVADMELIGFEALLGTSLGTWTISSGNTGNVFEIADGEVKLVGSLDAETHAVYSLEVNYSGTYDFEVDGITTVRTWSSTETVTISVLDVDEAPEWTEDAYEFIYKIGQSSTTSIGFVEAKDPEGNGIIYDYESDNEFFGITGAGEVALLGGSDAGLNIGDVASITVIASDGTLQSEVLVTVKVEEALGLKDSNYAVYPNPASEFLFINTSKQLKQYKIYDASGKLVIEGKLDGGKVDISTLRSGLYLLDLGESASSSRIRFVKH